MDADYFNTLSNIESGGKNIGSGTSSAFGPYQFTSGTWNNLIRSHPELGLSPIDRMNPAAQAAAIRSFTQDNADQLTKAGQTPSNTNLYMAHLLGAGGGAKFIAANSQSPNDPAFQHASPDAVAANKSLFFNADGSPKSVSQVYGNFDAKFNGGSQVQPIGQQTAAQPAPGALPQINPQQVGNLVNASPALAKLAASLQASGDALGARARSPLEAIGSILQNGVGMYDQNQAASADKDYATKLAAALQGGDKGTLATALLANPETRMAGFSLLAAPKPAADIKQIGTDYLGNPQYGKVYPDGRIEKIDPNALNAAGAQPGQANAATPTKTLTPDMTGKAALDALPPAIAGKVNKVLSGDDVLNPREKDYPQISALVYQVDPNFSRTDANVRYKYKQDFMAPNGNVGKTRVAQNTAIGHVDDLFDLAAKLPDHYLSVANTISNGISNNVKGESHDTLNQFNSVADALSGEMVKATTGSEGTQEQRNAFRAQLNQNNGTEAIQSALREFGGILNKKQNALVSDYASNMGGTPLPGDLISPMSHNTLTKLGLDGAQRPTPPPTQNADYTPNPNTGGMDKNPGAGIPSISTKADYDKLKSGSQYTAPDGSVRLKP